MRAAAKPLVVAVLGLLCSGPASAQSAPDLAQRDRLVLSFGNCVLSVAEKSPGEPNTVAERAFQACGTEEYAIRTWMRLNFAGPGQAEVFLINTRLNLKQMIRLLPR